MMFLDPCLFMPLSRAANIIFYFGSSAERDLAAACKSHCSLSHLCVECVSATEHHAASCLTFSFVSSVSLPQNITLHPVSPFPLYPACLCHGTSRCILSLNFSSVSSVSLSRNIGCSLSCLFLCVQCVSAMEHRAASCESQLSLSHLFFCILPVFATDIVLHPVSLTFSSVSSGSTLPLRYCALQNWTLYTCRYCLSVCNLYGASTFSFE